jgi:hypothetical protein
VQTKLKIKHFKWIWENSALFTNFNDKALDSLNDSNTITIDYINKEVKLRKDSAKNHIKTKELISKLKNTEDIHAHPSIMFYLLSPYF